MILAGDLGGTKSNLGIFALQGGKLGLISKRKISSHEPAQADEVIARFVADSQKKITAACFAAAGPVVNNRIALTNLSWVLDGPALAARFNLPQVPLLNDLEATAYGLRVLEPSDFQVLREGLKIAGGNQVLIAAGTGLGEAILFWDGTHHQVIATEGGHCDFAPRNLLEIELLRYMKQKYEIVSWEMILSGRGFREIHEFLDPGCHHLYFDDPGTDAAPDITRAALDNSCPVCVRTVDIWTEIYGAEAGNLTLKAVARGGVFVAGGIAVKILPKIVSGGFLEALDNKEKFHKFLEAIPVHVVLNEDAPLLGAAWVAARTLSAA